MKRHLFTILALLAAAPSFACTTAIVSAELSSTGRPLLWKQRDTGNLLNTVVGVPAKDGNYAYTALFNIDDIDCRSAYAGENEKGFAIVNNMSYNLQSGGYDARNGRAMRRALECCATVEDFDALMRTMEPRDVASNFGVVDATGAAAFFEVADSSFTRYDVPAGSWLVRTNFSLSGRENEPSGYARYQTAEYLMERHKGKFSPLFLIDGLGRSFHNAVLGYDASRKYPRGTAYDEDFIPRMSTSASVCFDGTGIMWTSVGYTPASYAMPLAVCGELPSCLVEANAFCDSLRHAMHPLPRDAGTKYIHFGIARKVMAIVRRYERRAAALSGDPAAMDALFEEFKKEF